MTYNRNGDDPGSRWPEQAVKELEIRKLSAKERLFGALETLEGPSANVRYSSCKFLRVFDDLVIRRVSTG